MPLFLVTSVCDEGVSASRFRVVEAASRLAVAADMLADPAQWEWALRSTELWWDLTYLPVQVRSAAGLDGGGAVGADRPDLGRWGQPLPTADPRDRGGRADPDPAEVSGWRDDMSGAERGGLALTRKRHFEEEPFCHK
jgi:hypothetical protein